MIYTSLVFDQFFYLETRNSDEEWYARKKHYPVSNLRKKEGYFYLKRFSYLYTKVNEIPLSSIEHQKRVKYDLHTNCQHLWVLHTDGISAQWHTANTFGYPSISYYKYVSQNAMVTQKYPLSYITNWAVMRKAPKWYVFQGYQFTSK